MLRSAPALLVCLAAATAACGDGAGGTGGSSSTGAGDGLGGTGQGGSGGDPAATTAAVASVVVSSAASSSTGVAPILCNSSYSTVIPSDECDLLQQDCAPGRHCTWKSAGGGKFTTTCEERGGLKNLGAECAIDAECEAGLFCIFGVCTPVCCPQTDEPCAGGNCNLNLSLDTNDVIRVCTYSKQCTPLTAEACPEDTGCHFEEPQVATCIPGSGEDVPEGGTCVALNDCANMQQCSPEEDVCRFICLLEQNSQPPGFGGCLQGQTCRTSDAIGLDGLGICAD